MNTVTTKLGQLSMDVTDNMLIEFVLKSLPPRFDHFKLTYSINLKAQILLLHPNQREGSAKRSIKGVLSKRTKRGKSTIKH